jgi:hypothetical protein
MKIYSFLVAIGLVATSQLVLAEQQNQPTTAITTSETTTTVDTDQAAVQPAEDSQATQMPVATEATTETEPSAQEENVPEQAGFSRGSVVRSVFTTGIQDREPVDQLSDTQGKTGNLFYFSELRDMSGQTAMHRWEHEGKVVTEVSFDVRGPRWRVWSSKTYSPGWDGEWKVSVVNGAGEVISEEMVTYTAPKVETTPAVASESPTDTTATDETSEQPFEPPVNPEMIQ